MNEQSFLIAIRDPDPELRRSVRDLLRDDVRFAHWWNHIPGVFLTITRVDVDTLSSLLRERLADASFLVTAIDLSRTDGWLPEESWEWIKRRERDFEAPTGAPGYARAPIRR